MSTVGLALSVMMIDDNDVDRMIGERLAERSGIVDHFVGFHSAIHALAHLDQESTPNYDVILLDQSMPNMDGVSFLREAQRLRDRRLSKTVIVMLTTILSEEDRISADSLGIVKGFMTKPLTNQTFIDLKDLVRETRLAN